MVFHNEKEIKQADERANKRRRANLLGLNKKSIATLEIKRMKERRLEWFGEQINLDDGKNKKLKQFKNEG